MSTDANKAIARRFIEEVWNSGRLDLADELLAPDLVSHDQPPGETGDREAFKRYIAATRARFPELRLGIEDMIAEGDKVATRVTMLGGTLAPGEGAGACVIGIVRIAGGRIAEQWADTYAAPPVG